jgi:peptide/nickel transport system permease protein
MYIRDIVTKFDFGTSYLTRQSVIQEVADRFPNTLFLAAMSMIVASLIGISLGIFSAVKQYSVPDTVFSVSAIFFAAVPNFWQAMVTMYIFSLVLGILPSSGATTWVHFIMPISVLCSTSAAQLLRLTRSTMLETIRQDYIRTARTKGASEARVIFRHALKNALLPIITILGINFGLLLGGAIVVEAIFAIPGLGHLLVGAIRNKDIPQVMACTLFISLLFCIIILIVDILYAFIDPRIKAKYAKVHN